MNHYERLGVRQTATPDEINKAYRNLAKTAHPDAGGNADEFKRLKQSRDLLADPEKRKNYDKGLNRRPPKRSVNKAARAGKKAAKKGVWKALKRFGLKKVAVILAGGGVIGGIISLCTAPRDGFELGSELYEELRQQAKRYGVAKNPKTGEPADEGKVWVYDSRLPGGWTQVEVTQ